MKLEDCVFGLGVITTVTVISCAILACSPGENPGGGVTTISETEVDELRTKLTSDPDYVWEVTANPKEHLPLVFAALKKNPEDQVWVSTISMIFAADQSDARGLPAGERRARYEAALGYLEECAKTIEAASPEATPFMKERAIASLEAGKLDAARRFAKKALEKNTDTDSWDYGNVIHWANTILGRADLRENNIEEAKKYLLESGRTPGSPQLDSFGPSFVFARELLEKGEKETVLEYMDLVAEFWANPGKADPRNSLKMRNAQEHARQLEEWKQEINQGRVPQDRRWR